MTNSTPISRVWKLILIKETWTNLCKFICITTGLCKTNAWQDLLNKYLPLVSTYVLASTKSTIRLCTCEYSPLASNYSWALLDMHYCKCKYLIYVWSNTHVFLVHSITSWQLSVKCVQAVAGMQKSTSVSVNLDVSCTLIIMHMYLESPFSAIQ